MRILNILIMPICLLFLGCSNLRMGVKAKRNPAISFESYKTYTIVDIGDDEFEHKFYAVNLAKKKLNSLGFKEENKKPDFAVWLGFFAEPSYGYYEYNPEIELIPKFSQGKYSNYQTAFPDMPKNCKPKSDGSGKYMCPRKKGGYVNKLTAVFIDLKSYPKNTDIKKYFKNLTDKNILENYREDGFKILSDKFEVKEIWLGCVGHAGKYPELKKNKIPVLIDTVFNSYPTEHMTKIIDVSASEKLDWL